MCAVVRTACRHALLVLLLHTLCCCRSPFMASACSGTCQLPTSILEAMVQNEFSGTTIDCASGLDAKAHRLLQGLFVDGTAMLAAQKAVIRQAGQQQPG